MRGDDAYNILNKKIKNQSERIKETVNEYLKENPVQSGATEEQAQQIKQNTDDVASLKEDISTKITKFYASSQGETHLADSDNGKIQDMMLYGKSEQKRYSGKNLLNATLQTTTQNGVTCTANGDGTYTINGTATSDTLFHIGYFIFEKDTKYKIVGCPQGGSLNTLYRLDGSLNANSDTGNGIVYSGDGNKRNARIVVFNGATVNNLLFKPMITTDLTATYDDFEPYTGGQPSPSPDYPQEIKSVVNPTVKVCGKNLLNPTLFKDYLLTMHGVTCKSVTDETGSYFLLDGTADSETDFWILGNTVFTYDGSADKLTISVREACPDSYYLCVGILERDFRNTKAVTTSLKSFSLYIHVLKGAVINNYRIYAQVEVGDIATDYEPYTEQTVTLPYTLNAIPVSSGGNVTIDGQQYIADYVDVERGKLVRMVANNRLLSSYNWNTANEYYWGSVSAATNGKTPITADNSKKMCACKYLFASSTYDVRAKKSGIAINNIKQVVIGLNYFASVDDLKTFLANNDVRLVYPLEVPTETDLTAEEITVFKALATYYPVTNIFINSEQLDGYTVFNYPISMENGWNYVKQQIGDTRDYIYDMDARAQDTDLQAAEAYVNSEYAVALTELEV